MSFEYPLTCPIIDGEIAKAKTEIQGYLYDLLNEACPLIPLDVVNEMSVEKAEKLYKYIEDVFEVTRRTNECMRSAAEDQIKDLKAEVEGLEDVVDELKNSIAILEKLPLVCSAV